MKLFALLVAASALRKQADTKPLADYLLAGVAIEIALIGVKK